MKSLICPQNVLASHLKLVPRFPGLFLTYEICIEHIFHTICVLGPRDCIH